MKIAILPNNSYCLATCDGGEIVIGDCTLKDCSVGRELEDYLSNSDHPCLTTLVEDEEPFFVAVNFCLGGQPISQSTHVGHFQTADGKKTLVIDEDIAGDRILKRDGDHLLIYAYQPSNLSFLPNQHCYVMTSDALITLEKDEYLGYKEGHIDSLTADELLEQLGRYTTGRSPAYERVQLSPVWSRPDRPVEGMFIYNKISQRLEYFDGTFWRTLKTEELE